MEDNNQKIQEMQFLEQNLQNILFQKQAFQMELAETESALKEIENAKDEVYKIIGQLMIKSSKVTMKEELDKKKKIFDLRIDAIEKQENDLSENLEKIREEILKK